MDYTVHGILQARILEWVAFRFSRGFLQPRDQTQVSHAAGGFFTTWATRETHLELGLAQKRNVKIVLKKQFGNQTNISLFSSIII